MSVELSGPEYGDLSVGIIITLERVYRSVLCCPRSENTRTRTRPNYPILKKRVIRTLQKKGIKPVKDFIPKAKCRKGYLS